MRAQLRKTLVAACLLSLAAGCTPFIKATDSRIVHKRDDAQRHMNQVFHQPQSQAVETVKFSEDIWLGNNSYRNRNGPPLPVVMDKVTLISAEPMSLREIAAEITAITDIPVLVESGLGEATSEEEETTTTATATEATAETLMLVSYSGALKNLLNQVALRFGYTWEYRENAIYLLQYVTRTFALHALPTNSSLTNSVQGATESGSTAGGDTETLSSSGSTLQTEVSTTIAIWEEIQESIETMLPEGSRLSLSPTSGTITVSSTPWAMRKVEDYIEQQNDILSRQVALSVKVLSVTISSSDNYNFSLDTVINRLADKGSLTIVGPRGDFSDLSGVGSVSVSLLRGNGNFDIDTIIQALSDQTKMSLITSAAVTTLNNQAAPVQVVRRQGYLRQSTTTSTETSTSTSLEPGTITTGFMINMLPRILVNGEILLQYTMSLSELNDITTLTAGTSTDSSLIQLPDVTTRDFLQQIRMCAGDMLVISGFEQSEDRSEKKGTGRPDNFMFGGASQAEGNREVIVILITPHLLG
ncbi:MAG: PilN family type IVB pilus formation outer membrane protein [Pseudomonadota bacterium]|nr:PilN family type IVB pilus formation outer membrane protein [Pseudomonadota bacterium]